MHIVGSYIYTIKLMWESSHPSFMFKTRYIWSMTQVFDNDDSIIIGLTDFGYDLIQSLEFWIDSNSILQ
jgi:hypothetical protein